MTRPSQVASADAALKLLTSAPDFTGAGVKLVAIVPDSQQHPDDERDAILRLSA